MEPHGHAPVPELGLKVGRVEPRRDHGDEDPGKLLLDDGLADVFEVAAPVEENPGDRGDDTGPVRAHHRQDHLVHGVASPAR